MAKLQERLCLYWRRSKRETPVCFQGHFKTKRVRNEDVFKMYVCRRKEQIKT